LTAIVADPDPSARRRLVSLITEAGHRCIPAVSGEETIDLAKRFHFDAAFCTAWLPGTNCLELFESLQQRVSAFVVLAEGSEATLLNSLPQQGVRLLHKPVEPAELRRLLAAIGGQLSTPAR